MKRQYTLKSKKSKTRKQSGGNIAMNTHSKVSNVLKKAVPNQSTVNIGSMANHSKVSNVFKKMIPNQSTINATKRNYQSKVRNVFQKAVPSFLLTK
jgi:mannose/fructose/N-acetylgalactosamine-specific phosphotransferase system component IIB